MTAAIIAIIIMSIWIPFFIWTNYKWNPKIYIFTKTFSSILFITIAVLGHLSGIAPAEYSTFIIIALVLGLMGDVFLVYSKNLVFFRLGVLWFLIGQIVYGTLFYKYGGFSPYDFIIYAAIIAMSLIVYSKSQLEFKEMKIPSIFYLCAITFMYTMGLSTIYKGCFRPLTTIFIVIGTTLFVASDMVLAFNLFKPNSKPILKNINLVLYYYGQMILAASILTFIN